MIFAKRFRYRFGDIDDAGVAYFPKLLHYFHCAFEDWWAEGLHYPYSTLMQQDRLGFPVVKLDAEFFAPVRYGDEPWVHMGILRVGNASAEFGFWMTRDGATAPLNRARITLAVVHLDTMRPHTLPENWRARFADYAIAEHELPPPRKG